MNEAERAIGSVFDAYRAAVLAKDVDAFVALYEPTVRVFDLWEEWSYDGATAWRAMVTKWFTTAGTSDVVVEFDDVRITQTGDLGIAHAFVTFRGQATDGREKHSMLNRLTWVLERHAGTWKIAHEHTSAPVDFDTFKVTLRPPGSATEG